MEERCGRLTESRSCAAWSSGAGADYQEELSRGRHTSCSRWENQVWENAPLATRCCTDHFADSSMARDSFATFIPLSVESDARTKIIFDFFDLLSAIAAHGKTNGLGGPKIVKVSWLVGFRSYRWWEWL